MTTKAVLRLVNGELECVECGTAWGMGQKAGIAGAVLGMLDIVLPICALSVL
jgi:hypothetical protein